MKNVLILGAGTGGALIANILSKKLDSKEWRVTVIDRSPEHHYQPGYLFLPFRLYGYEDAGAVAKPIRAPLKSGVRFIAAQVNRVDHAKRSVETSTGNFDYDFLVVAMGCRVAPEEVEGLQDAMGKHAFTFYNLAGALAFQKPLDEMKEGRLVVNIADTPVKCPVAPLEFCLLADYFFTKKGIRDRIEIELVTPLSGAFTKPVANRVLTGFLLGRNIKVTADFQLASVDPSAKTLESYTGKKVGYDLLCTIPPNLGPQAVEDSGLGDGAGFALTEDKTLKSKKAPNIYVIGDNTNLHTSKAGSVTHFEAEIAAENILREIAGKEPAGDFDGHSNCFIETGHYKAYMIDFNYDVEPVHGMFPLPVVGPFSLLGNSYINHLGKMAFKWVYWNLLLTGGLYGNPFFPPRMSLAGKNLGEIQKH